MTYDTEREKHEKTQVRYAMLQVFLLPFSIKTIQIKNAPSSLSTATADGCECQAMVGVPLFLATGHTQERAAHLCGTAPEEGGIPQNHDSLSPFNICKSH